MVGTHVQKLAVCFSYFALPDAAHSGKGLQENIFAGAGQKLGETQAHRGPISALQYVKPQKERMLLSAGKFDHLVRLLQVRSQHCLGKDDLACQMQCADAGGIVLCPIILVRKLNGMGMQVPSEPAHLRRATCAAVYKGHSGSVLGIAAAPSGDHFVSASQDKTLRIWPTGLRPSVQY